MVSFVLGLIVLVGVIVWLKWLANAEPAAVKRSVFYASALLLLLATLLLIGTGKLPAAFGTATLAFVVYQRYRQLKGLWNIYSSWSGRGAGPTGGGTGQASVVETEWLRMTLNHDTGELAGEVLKGGFAGRALSELGEAELAALYQELRDADGESARLLEAYLDRVMGGESRTGAGSGESGPATGAPPQMTEEEALGILGLSKGVDAATIRDAHKRLIKKLHPDLGGSDYLAAKINEAKEFLLRRRGEG